MECSEGAGKRVCLCPPHGRSWLESIAPLGSNNEYTRLILVFLRPGLARRHRREQKEPGFVRAWRQQGASCRRDRNHPKPGQIEQLNLVHRPS